MWSGLPKLVFVTTLVINGVLWSQSRYAVPSTQIPTTSLFKRAFLELHDNSTLGILDSDTCRPLAFLVEEQCKVVQEGCAYSDTFLSIPYVQRYFCAAPSVRPFLFTGLVFWLIFLFSTLGISASDFFCPNLGTLSQLLGLDENVAGVTFLAFGNGSPDVFSTFSAMRTNSGGLAIGELLGAAAFVTSCVVGSMCIIKPFAVEKWPFLRDVGFFTIAVLLLLFTLWDHHITQWESMGMVALYTFYVLVVVVGSWYERRRERLRRLDAMMRDEYREERPGSPYFDEPYRDESPLPDEAAASLLTPNYATNYARTRAISNPGPPRLGLEMPNGAGTRSTSPSVHSTRSHPHSRSTGSHITPHTPHPHMPSFSLIGALEFRRVVTSLQQDAASSSLALFDPNTNTPITPYPGGHSRYHSFSGHPRSRPLTPLSHQRESDPWDAALGVPLDDRSPPQLQRTNQLHADGDDDDTAVEHPNIMITHTPASPRPDEIEADDRHGRGRRPVRAPTANAAAARKVVSVFAAPAVMILTLTLPVVVTDFTGAEFREEKKGGLDEDDVRSIIARSERLVDFEEEGVERTLIAEHEVEEEMHELKFNKWLMAVQCVLGPLWCVAVLFDNTPQEPWFLLAAGVCGLTVAVLVAVFARSGETPTSRLARCTMGFIVSIVWIMAIADEVVEVLKTFGLIFGFSDAIIGLTIFAMGNSLADLVANMSVAVFAPIMGFSACFGGPMLNILLGIGISGTYIISQGNGEPYNMHFSRTLVITGMGLLALLLVTLVYVPWNGYFLSRAWGVALIVAYTGLMAANVVVEILTEGE
ncbi:hypothetical protein EIP91_008185 [Steccherinum ochraceum]|uniref:Sodium/calcium exchanger membrane region domain-containing protein n=1 Tax=Steccherinum ochraceum TaxID=92696 RepID=A0A4R0RBE5_9APHY|nr:hypothetical protein EIP91_008185 [Steccherinum ochraceum]